MEAEPAKPQTGLSIMKRCGSLGFGKKRHGKLHSGHSGKGQPGADDDDDDHHHDDGNGDVVPWCDQWPVHATVAWN